MLYLDLEIVVFEILKISNQISLDILKFSRVNEPFPGLTETHFILILSG